MRGVFVIGAAVAAAIGSTASASESMVAEYVSPIAANAENIRSLNIMLMVTSLRCRATAHDFQSDYDTFALTHRQNLAEASRHLRRNLSAAHGEKGSMRELDRIGVTIANKYGHGHPTLGCADLKSATQKLAMTQDRQHLSRMADRLLSHEPVGEQIRIAAPIEPKLKFDAQAIDTAPAAEGNEAKKEGHAAPRVPIWLRG